MGTSKTDHFSKRINLAAKLCHALGHPARIMIYEILLSRKRLIATDITANLPLAQATVAQHLKTMVAAGLLEFKVEGHYAYYSINTQAVTQLQSILFLLQNKAPSTNKTVHPK